MLVIHGLSIFDFYALIKRRSGKKITPLRKKSPIPSKKYVVPEGKIWKINRSRWDETKYKSYRDSYGNWIGFGGNAFFYNEKGVNMARSDGGGVTPEIVFFPGMYFTASLIKEVNDQKTIISGAPVYVWYTEEDLPAGSTWK